MTRHSRSCTLVFLLVTSWLLLGCGESTDGDSSSGDSDNGGNSGSANGGSGNGGSGNGGSANGGSANGGSANGGSAGAANGGSANGGSGGMQDIDSCDGFPRAGQACAPIGSQCQVPGSPCGSIFTCSSGAWTEEVRCPPTPTCPNEIPELGTACQGISPAAGLTCFYESGCGSVTATCEGGSWNLAPEPVEECRALCQEFCVRLAGCDIDWADECIPLCELEYLCPGESPGQDAAICETELASLDADCNALCDSAAFAPSCP
jgi:hypothetical protein